MTTIAQFIESTNTNKNRYLLKYADGGSWSDFSEPIWNWYYNNLMSDEDKAKTINQQGDAFIANLQYQFPDMDRGALVEALRKCTAEELTQLQSGKMGQLEMFEMLRNKGLNAQDMLDDKGLFVDNNWDKLNQYRSAMRQHLDPEQYTAWESSLSTGILNGKGSMPSQEDMDLMTTYAKPGEINRNNAAQIATGGLRGFGRLIDENDAQSIIADKLNKPINSEQVMVQQGNAEEAARTFLGDDIGNIPGVSNLFSDCFAQQSDGSFVPTQRLNLRISQIYNNPMDPLAIALTRDAQSKGEASVVGRLGIYNLQRKYGNDKDAYNKAYSGFVNKLNSAKNYNAGLASRGIKGSINTAFNEMTSGINNVGSEALTNAVSQLRQAPTGLTPEQYQAIDQTNVQNNAYASPSTGFMGGTFNNNNPGAQGALRYGAPLAAIGLPMTIGLGLAGAKSSSLLPLLGLGGLGALYGYMRNSGKLTGQGWDGFNSMMDKGTGWLYNTLGNVIPGYMQPSINSWTGQQYTNPYALTPNNGQQRQPPTQTRSIIPTNTATTTATTTTPVVNNSAENTQPSPTTPLSPSNSSAGNNNSMTKSSSYRPKTIGDFLILCNLHR